MSGAGWRSIATGSAVPASRRGWTLRDRCDATGTTLYAPTPTGESGRRAIDRGRVAYGARADRRSPPARTRGRRRRLTGRNAAPGRQIRRQVDQPLRDRVDRRADLDGLDHRRRRRAPVGGHRSQQESTRMSAGQPRLRRSTVKPGGAHVAGGAPSTHGAHTALAITPDQGPSGEVRRGPCAGDIASAFQGGASFDPDGIVTTGPGTSATARRLRARASHVPAARHVYRDAHASPTTRAAADARLHRPGHVVRGQPLRQFSRTISVEPLLIRPPPDQTCATTATTAFAAHPTTRRRRSRSSAFNDGASINDVDAPDELVGSITPDPSGIKQIRLRFTRPAGISQEDRSRETRVRRARKRSARRVRSTRRPVGRCTASGAARARRWSKAKTKVPACLTSRDDRTTSSRIRAQGSVDRRTTVTRLSLLTSGRARASARTPST